MSLSELELYNVLRRECHLASDALASALTAIRTHNFAQKGRLYTGFFMMAIGLERVCKMCVMLNRQILDKRLPTNTELKTIGHDLVTLLNKTKEIRVGHRLAVDVSCFDDSLTDKIVVILSCFARYTRYYNIDYLVGATKGTDREPLQHWHGDVHSEIIKRHAKTTKRTQEWSTLGDLTDENTGMFFLHSDLDGSEIRDFKTFAAAASKIDLLQQYDVVYLHRIVMFVVRVLLELQRLISAAWALNEFFEHIMLESVAEVRRKKNWYRR